MLTGNERPKVGVDFRPQLLSNRYGFVTSGGASAVKEPGHYEVRKSSSQVTRMHFFLLKVDFFSCRPQNRPPTPFHRHNKTNKAVRYCNIFTALHGMQTRSSDENSVRPSVCLSITRGNCDKTVERSVQIYIPYERSFSPVF